MLLCRRHAEIKTTMNEHVYRFYWRNNEINLNFGDMMDDLFPAKWRVFIYKRKEYFNARKKSKCIIKVWRKAKKKGKRCFQIMTPPEDFFQEKKIVYRIIIYIYIYISCTYVQSDQKSTLWKSAVLDYIIRLLWNSYPLWFFHSTCINKIQYSDIISNIRFPFTQNIFDGGFKNQWQ